MHQKYLSGFLPTMADGDFMGFYLENENDKDELSKIIINLINEGICREEKVLVDEFIYSYVPQSLKASAHLTDAFSLHSNADCCGNDAENCLALLRNASLEQGFSGLRFLGSDEHFFLCGSDRARDSHEKDKKALKAILRYLMKGGASMGIFYPNTKDISFEKCARHPRIYFKNRVSTNPLFVRPEILADGKSGLYGYLSEEIQKKADIVSEEVPFPVGIPNMLESIVDSMGLGVVVGDLYGNMVLLNKAAQDILGLPPSPLPYAERIRRFGNFLPDEETPYPFDDLPLSRAVRGESIDNEIVVIKRSSLSESLFLSSTGRPVTDQGGNLIGGVLVFRDVSEEKKTQKEKEALEYSLLNTQKMESLGLLAGGIAHDFNNLLVGVLGNASMLLQQKLVSHEGVARLEQIQTSALSLSELTSQLLVYAGLSPMKDLQKFCIARVLTSMRGIAETGVSKKVEIVWSLSDEDLFIEGDEVQVKQLLLNFILNASDAHKNNTGIIRVDLDKKYLEEKDFKGLVFNAEPVPAWYVSLMVTDTGVGISQENLDRIFDPFFSTKGAGRGLGLSASIGIVKNHRGALRLNSTFGKGTTFEVLFPLVEGSGVTTQEHRAGIVPENKEKGMVLIVDDEPMVLDVADAILSHAGYNVQCAESGRKGLEMFDKLSSSIRAVVLDMTMSDVSGEYVYSKIRKAAPEMPVLMASGFSKELCFHGKVNDSNFHFLPKPYTADSLLVALEFLLSANS